MVNYGNLCQRNVNNVSGKMPDKHLNKIAVKNKYICNTITCTLRIIIHLYIFKIYAWALRVKRWLRMTIRTTITQILLAFLWPRPLKCALVRFYHTIFSRYSTKRGKNLVSTKAFNWYWQKSFVRGVNYVLNMFGFLSNFV